jgi:hypothetical protein
LASASLVCGAPWRVRALNELGAAPGEVEVLVVNRTTRHSIRVRNYEADLDATRVPLANVPDPIGVKQRALARLIGTVFPVRLRGIAAGVMKMTEPRSGTA